ncbi:class I SAM-dependent DNA methyltransferase [Hymenobacter sp. IS2118]|uniref:class I SAM-dependent DNA methyltransferase n=1 Tax=Hymenobacter sp. IS2118 TaxID=1505605 RepID=UPI0009DCE2ED|nr:class I SAM-dependent DNA methyltransferase [Hymenobacter sp. IS2118]
MDTMLFDRVPRPRIFEEDLWEAADLLRVKSKLKSSEYAAPLLGLFFLRYATNRFEKLMPEAEAKFGEQTGRNVVTREQTYTRVIGYQLPDTAHFDKVLGLLPRGTNVQEKVVAAMQAFEDANNVGLPAGQAPLRLPQTAYRNIPDDVLADIIGTVAKVKAAEGDVFGQIYEYFLGKFALSEGQKGGEFYTPTSVVRLIVEILEPHTGLILDPACGTGGMFVQSAKFVRSHEAKGHLSIYGQEKVRETAELARLNLFVNGLKSDIRNVVTSLADTAYEGDYANTAGKFDFVMANPPFNVDGVGAADVNGHSLFTTYGPKLAEKGKGKTAETYGNANYLWVSLFATALKPTGRAGFVMPNSASDARGAEAEARAKLVEAGMVDVMVTVASNFFYTVTLPVTLWFLDRAKTDETHPRHDQMLMLDARRTYHQVTRKLRQFTEAQQQNLTAVVWLYRGETENFQALRQRYLAAFKAWRDTEITDDANETPVTYRGVAAQRGAYAQALADLAGRAADWRAGVEMLLSDAAREALLPPYWVEGLDALLTLTADQLPVDKAGLQALGQRAEALVNFAEKSLRPEKDKTWAGAGLRGLLKRAAEARELLLFVLERVAYFEAQLAWLDGHFPDGEYRDVEGLCYRASRADIAKQQYSLNPGRYVGVALEDDGRTPEEFREFVEAQAGELARLHQEADQLKDDITRDIAMLFMDVVREEVAIV